MKDLNLRVFQLTGNSAVFSMKASEVAQVIIDKILQDENGLVSDKFMVLMADHLHKFFAINPRVWALFAEICMQRISVSAMQLYNIHHENWLNGYAIPSNFKSWSKSYQEVKKSDKVYNFADMIPKTDIINEECMNFLYKQGDHIFKHSKRSHMRDILAALIDDMTEFGEYNTILVAKDINRLMVLGFAQRVLYDNAPVDFMLEHIANKEIWYKHMPYIKRNWHLINKRDFATKIGMRGIFKGTRLFCKVFL